MKSTPALVALLAFSTVANAVEERPSGPNCHLTAPPPSAGEIPNHAGLTRVYPRARDISAEYSGCQVLFVPDHGLWILGLIEIVNGDPKRTWAPELNEPEQDACRFEAGKVIQGNPSSCHVEENELLLKSYASGCMKRFETLNAGAKKATRTPVGCATQE